MEASECGRDKVPNVSGGLISAVFFFKSEKKHQKNQNKINCYSVFSQELFSQWNSGKYLEKPGLCIILHVADTGHPLARSLWTLRTITCSIPTRIQSNITQTLLESRQVKDCLDSAPTD